MTKEYIMAKKTLKKKVQAKPEIGKFAAPMVDSAKEIWLAGLGAFSVAQQEGGKLIEQGNKLFEKLVSEGEKLEKKTRDLTETTVGDLRGGVESRVDSVKQQAVDNWDKLEGIFEDRVARVLGRLGVPTADDVNKLSKRVADLSKQVSAMSKTNGAKKPAARKLLCRTGEKGMREHKRLCVSRSRPRDRKPSACPPLIMDWEGLTQGKTHLASRETCQPT
jgi:poly(hydroxyalkanoate) granule-associated protein